MAKQNGVGPIGSKPMELKQLASLISALFSNADLNALSREDAQWIIDAPTHVGPLFDAFLKATADKMKKLKNRILEYVGKVNIPAITGKFVAKEKFVVDTSPDALVKINYIGNSFTKLFLSGDGKTEDPIGEQTTYLHKLLQFSLDDHITAELGGEELVYTTLYEMFSLMEKQGKGEDGVLLNNGWANIFYIKDVAGVLRSVTARWNSDGWGVDAFPIEGPGRWGVGAQVFASISVP